jgi:hypothetical protein
MNAGKLPRGWKTQATQRCQEVIARTPDGSPVKPDDAEFVMALLARHPDAAAKTGCGIAWLTAATEERWHRGRHFVIVRTDGSRTDFSWRECITPSSHVTKCRDAMRNAVADQVIAFREASRPHNCALDPAHPGPYDVDHYDPPFITLADRYAAVRGGYAGIALLPHGDGDLSDELSPDDAAVWTRYHEYAARLRMLCRKCNGSGAAQ